MSLQCVGFFLVFCGLSGSSTAQVLAVKHATAKSQDMHSVAQLSAKIRKLEANWDDPHWDQELVHQQIRALMTQFVTYQLNEGPAARNGLEKTLATVIQESIRRSWSEHPARVLLCCSGVPQTYIVAFVLDEAAGGSTSVIQVYKPDRGIWVLADEGGSEINGCDMEILALPFSPREIRIFAYGQIIGANQAPTVGILYSFSGGHIRPIWKMKNTWGLSAKLKGDALILEYMDTKRYYEKSHPYQFQDVYMQSSEGLKLISQKSMD